MTTKELKINVEKALEEIRPYLLTDGGDISLIDIENNIVRVQLLGACVDCSIKKMTLANGVEATIKRYAPQIEKVIEISQEH